MDSIRAIALGRAAGGGGSSVEVGPLSAAENGTYTAPAGTAYSPVVVSVPQGGGQAYAASAGQITDFLNGAALPTFSLDALSWSASAENQT